MSTPPSSTLRQVRAAFDMDTLRVYQAFSNEIADAALRAQTFVGPFKRSRMTWIKPSFCWMMYRSGWATKQGQERILGIDIARDGFEWALAQSCTTAFDPTIHPDADAWSSLLRSSPVRIQWDPERALSLQPLPIRTIQIGLSGRAVDAYVDTWIRRIDDLTALSKQIEALVGRGETEHARQLLPNEQPYPLSENLAHRIGCLATRA